MYDCDCVSHIHTQREVHTYIHTHAHGTYIHTYIHTHTHTCIRDYLTNKKQYTLFQSSESPKSNVLCEVPQGSILDPILFLIYINDIIYSSPLLSFIFFADDTNIFYSHKNFHSLITTLNSELSKVSSWFICNKLSLNIAKTNFMLFKPSNSQNIRHNNFNIHIEGLPIIEKKATKFLGVIIDSSLS